jgi:hypothetical protein
MNRRVHRPSPALGVALLALFVALGGTGYAASQIQRPGIPTARVAKAPNQGPRGFRGPRGFKGATGATGQPGATGPAGSALAYARVVNGTIDAANTKNVTVTQATATYTCLDVTTLQTPHNVIAMIDNSGANPQTASAAGTLNPVAVGPACPTGSDAVIVTSNAGVFTLLPFYVTFN